MAKKGYNIELHGDSLEKEYAPFIRSRFPAYEAVWKLYIGNKGNNTRASIPKYPEPREACRAKFSEHTYTILQSVICLFRITQKDIFKATSANKVDEILDIQDSLISFSAHLGRIRDNAVQASENLVDINLNLASEIFSEFYHIRHLFIHGKTLPILFEASGQVFIPNLSKSSIDRSGWNHKYDNWSNVIDYSVEKADLTLENLFQKLLNTLAKLFGEFKAKIVDELGTSFVLDFEYTNYDITYVPVSGSTSIGVVSVYGIDKLPPNTW